MATGQELISFLGSQTASHVSRPNVGHFSIKKTLTILIFSLPWKRKTAAVFIVKDNRISWQLTGKEGRNGEKKDKETVDQELEDLSSKLQICTYHETPYVK